MSSRNRTAQFAGISQTVRDLESEIDWAARSDAKVLITGESGVGKEIAARLIHQRSRRSAMPLVTINCAGIPDTLLESELFGHERGSVTGAHRDRSGLLELAQGGSVLLDEVGEMSLRLQGTLLRFLETGEIQRVGAHALHTRVNVRVISATNRDLPERIGSHEFREDLYYRLNVINITIPPLRNRREDIPMLLRQFLAAHAEDHQARPLELAPEALARLVAYDWPGNVRQLRNIVERLVVRAQLGQTHLTAADLPPELGEPGRRRDAGAGDEREVAEILFDRMVRGKESFWMVPYAMFMARDITRTDLRAIIAKGLRQTAGSYKDLPALFNLPPEDYKRLLSFLRQHKCHVPFQPYRPVSPRAAKTKVAGGARVLQERRWRRKPVDGTIAAEAASVPARILDVSYGGVRVALSDVEHVPKQFDLKVVDTHIVVPAQRVWTRRLAGTDESWCGVEIIRAPSSDLSDWQKFVDSVGA